MKLIKNVLVYKAALPPAAAMRVHLAEIPFAEPNSMQAQSHGFIYVDRMFDLVSEFEGGYAFSWRIDEKVVPASAVAAELKKRCEVIEEDQGHPPGRKQRRDIKDGVIEDFTARALIKSTPFVCFYDKANQYLFIPTTSTSVADRIIGDLIRATGSVKMSTIHVDDMKNGLTTRLNGWLEEFDDGHFGTFEPCDAVTLARGKETISIKVESLESAQVSLRDALRSGFTVTAMRLSQGDSFSFGLTSSFRIKAIAQEIDSLELESHDERFVRQAAVELFSLSAVVTELCTLLGYREPVDLLEAA